MTIRGATTRESPDGHVLYIGELRKHLGLGTSDGENSTTIDAPVNRPEVLLFGHDMHDDFRKMEQDGIDIKKYLHYAGCVDTQVLIEDNGEMGKSLSSLVSWYGLAELEYKKPRFSKGGMHFVGSHCAGNDAVMTVDVALALTFDPGLKSNGDWKDRPDDWLDKPLVGINTNMILLGYDTEGADNANYKPNVLNRTSEHGFAWLRLADVAHIAPGKDGRNWRPMIRARHWINHDFRSFQNQKFCVGNPNGFWPEYGKSEYYRVADGPAPFHRLFEELAGVAAGIDQVDNTVEDVTTMLGKTAIEESSSVSDGKPLDTRRGNGHFRGNLMRGRGRSRGSSARGRGGKGSYRGGDHARNSAWREDTTASVL